VRDAKENCKKKGSRAKSWGHAASFFSQFSFASRTTDKAKEGLLVVYHIPVKVGTRTGEKLCWDVKKGQAPSYVRIGCMLQKQ